MDTQEIVPTEENYEVTTGPIRRSAKVGALMSALAKAQGEFEILKKDSDNPFFGSKYADLAAVIAAIRGPLSKNGIAMMHFPVADLERHTANVTVGFYKDEQFFEVTAEAPANGKGKDGLPKFDVQTIGSCWTYLRRYLLQGMAALASEDDDGNSLQGDNLPIPAKKGAVVRQENTKPSGSQFPEPTVNGDTLSAYVLKVETKETKATPPVPFYAVKISGSVRNTSLLFCWHLSLGGAIEKSTGKMCSFKVQEAKGYLNIVDVLEVDKQKFKGGIAQNENSPEITNSDLSDALFGDKE